MTNFSLNDLPPCSELGMILFSMLHMDDDQLEDFMQDEDHRADIKALFATCTEAGRAEALVNMIDVLDERLNPGWR